MPEITRPPDPNSQMKRVQATGHRNRIDTPVLTSAQVAPAYIELQLCAPSGRGATGLPGGFSIQRMTQADFDANGGW